jgi:hypothetical protein
MLGIVHNRFPRARATLQHKGEQHHVGDADVPTTCPTSSRDTPSVPSSSSGGGPPPVAPAVPPGGRHRFGGNLYWPVPGGFLVYNRADESIDGHCSCDAHEDRRNACRINRVRLACKRGSNLARGRPIGFLMAWLAAASTKDDAASHKRMSNPRTRTPDDLEHFTLAKRESGRQWVVDRGGMTDLLGLERPQRPGEGPEPEGLV